MEFTDPFDWPATMPELRTIDNLLRCGICCEFLNIAMILPKCSHNYCSQCIRRYMNYKSQCPTCNTPTIEGEIRNNKVVDEIVKNFVQVRPHILKLCKGQGEKSHDTSEMVTPTSRKDGKRLPKSSERTSSLTPGTAFAVKEASRFFTSGTPKRKPELSEDVPLNRSNEENISPSDDADVVIIDEDKSTSPTTPPPPESSPSASTSNENSATIPSTRSDKSTCPVCGVPVALKHINLHLDSCLKRSSENPKPTRKEKRKPLPKLVYNIMSDKQLRKKLKEYKLATQGTRKELIRRMQEFTVLYNAQCDSDDPIPVNDVIKYYERMEKIRNKAQPKSTSQAFKLNLEKCQNEDDISKSQQNYLQHHSQQFDNLIKIAKEKMKKSKKLPSMENAGSLQDEPCSDPSSTSNAGVNSISDKSTSDNVANPELLGAVSDSCGPGTEIAEESSSAGSSKSDESDLSDFEQRKENLGSKQTSIVCVKSLKTNVATTSELECPPLPELPGGDKNETSDLEPDSPSLFDSASFSEEEFVDESKQSETSADSNIQKDSAMNDRANSIETNHMADQTSPVFTGSRKKDMDVTSNAYASCSSPSLTQEHLEPAYLKRDGPLPQNKLRRKRKTALEQLETDLSNVTEDSGRRASKRNKKM